MEGRIHHECYVVLPLQAIVRSSKAFGECHWQVYNTYRYTFDRVYDTGSQQAEVYEHSAQDAVHQALEVRRLPKPEV